MRPMPHIPLPRFALALGLALAVPAFAADTPDARLGAIADAVDAQALHATVEKLVGFGTRHTLSDTASGTRGIGAARRWAKARFEAISKDCGGCLEIVTPAQTITGKRAPNGVEIVDVVAIQRGTGDPGRVVAITGCRSTGSARPSSTACCPARSRACTAARCSRTTRRRRAGAWRPT
jgi:hypothetical protein